MVGHPLKKRKKSSVMKKDIYTQVKKERKAEQKEYTSFCERLTDAVSLTEDVAGEMIVYLAGRHCMSVRNFLSVTEYTAKKIRLKNKKYELHTEGECLRMEYFLPEELRIIGNIKTISYHATKG